MESESEEDEGGKQDCARDIALAASEEALPAVIAQQEVAVEDAIAAQTAPVLGGEAQLSCPAPSADWTSLREDWHLLSPTDLVQVALDAHARRACRRMRSRVCHCRAPSDR